VPSRAVVGGVCLDLDQQPGPRQRHVDGGDGGAQVAVVSVAADDDGCRRRQDG